MVVLPRHRGDRSPVDYRLVMIVSKRIGAAFGRLE
jgi:hypothetical protein